MSAPTVGAPPDVPRQSEAGEMPFLITRAGEAERIAAFIASSTARFIVLCGEELSGKTLLVTRWLIPALGAAKGRDGYRVLYGKCAPGFPDTVSGDAGDEPFDAAMARRSVVFIDDFDRVLEAPRDDRRQALDRLFDTLHRASDGAIIIVVVSGRQLTSAYALSSYEPDILNAVCEIRSLGLAEGLEQLSREDPASAVTYSAEVLQALRDDSRMLARQGLDASFDLLQFLHERFSRQHAESGGREIDLAQYRRMGGLSGILRTHVDHQLEPLEIERPGTADVARAILHRIALDQSRGATPDLGEVAPRFGIPDEDVQAILARLTEPAGLLARGRNGTYQFRPPQVVAIVEEDNASGQLHNERAQRIVDEALRSWQLLGTFLPRARFAELHRQRRHLALGDELNRFLLQCALRHGDADLAGAPAYWLRRVASRDDGMDVLLSAAFDTDAQVRVRAATMLGDFPEEIVRERLSVLALNDEMAAVRDAAVASLARMADDALLERILREVGNPKNARQEHAVEALRIFAQPKVSAELQAVVCDPQSPRSLRDAAISVLAAHELPESIDVLVDVALHGPSVEDRDAAAKALASTSREDLNRRVLSRLGWRRPSARIVAAGAIVTLAFPAATLVAFLAAPVWIFNFLNTTWLLGVVTIALLALPLATRMALDRLGDGLWNRRSPAGVLAMVLFVLSGVFVLPGLHGVGHIIVHRTRRGLFLLGLEALAIVLFTVVASATEFIPGLGLLATLYRVLGAVLFVGTYVYDLVEVTLGTFVLRGVTAREDRRSAIYRTVFGNPSMVDVAFAELRSGAPDDARRARSLIRRFADAIPSSKLVQMFDAADPVYRPHVIRALEEAKDDEAIAALEKRWIGAPARERRDIAAILASRPTAQSSAALRRLATGGNMLARLRAIVASIQFRLALWPRSARFATLCFVPAVAVLLYHGVMTLRNHAWGEIVLLRQGLPTVERKVKIVNFLVDVYPVEAAPELRRLFREGRRRDVNAVQASIARGLTTILDSAAIGDRDGLRADLSAELVRFDSLLANPDSAMFALGVNVVERMAAAADSALSARAVRSLTGFVAKASTPVPDLTSRKRRVVVAIGGLSYARALPALDTLLRMQRAAKRQSNVEVADIVRDQITQVAKQAYAALPIEGNRSDRTALLATLDRLAYAPADVVTQLNRELRENDGRCDRNGDNTCDAKDEALRFIAESPMSEDGYRDLYDHYAEQRRYRDAESAFQSLAELYPRSIWPLKILAEMYHENRAITDTAYFTRSYEAMISLRKLDAFDRLATEAPVDHLRIESDYAEVALSARQFAEAESAAKEVLAASTDNLYRLNMSLFLYFASVMKHEPDSAAARLTRLEAVVRSLGSDYANNWVYPGTLAFIGHSDLSPRLKQALRSLCKEGDWYTPPEASTVIAANRVALKTLLPTASVRATLNPER